MPSFGALRQRAAAEHGRCARPTDRRQAQAKTVAKDSSSCVFLQCFYELQNMPRIDSSVATGCARFPILASGMRRERGGVKSVSPDVARITQAASSRSHPGWCCAALRIVPSVLTGKEFRRSPRRRLPIVVVPLPPRVISRPRSRLRRLIRPLGPAHDRRRPRGRRWRCPGRRRLGRLRERPFHFFLAGLEFADGL